MLSVTFPDQLSTTINQLAGLFCQTPENLVIEMIEERIQHDSAYTETAYLSKSIINQKRLNQAIVDINTEKYEKHELLRITQKISSSLNNS